MPKEEKDKKRIKAVTEEIVDSAPEPEVQEEKIQEEKIEEVVSDSVIEKPEEKDEKPMFAVRETDNYSGSAKPEKGMFLKIFMVTFFATLLAFLLAGGIYVYLNGTKGGSNNQAEVVSATPSPIASSEPAASLAPEAKLDTYKISVLNGNGGIGVAGAAKSIIETAGFKVLNTSNADSFDFTDTEISVKSGIPASIVAKLKEALSTKYSIKIGDNLDSASSYDIVVTVGSK